MSGKVDDAGDLLVTALDASRPVVVITDHRTGRFSLRLDDRWVLQEFDYDGVYEAEVLQDLCAVALAYLRGKGELRTTRVGFWGFSHSRPTCAIEVGGTVHSGIDFRTPG